MNIYYSKIFSLFLVPVIIIFQFFMIRINRRYLFFSSNIAFLTWAIKFLKRSIFQNISSSLSAEKLKGKFLAFTRIAHKTTSYEALDKKSVAFKYHWDFFPKLFVVKVKAGVFMGPQIKKIIEHKEFLKKLSRKEKKTWESIAVVIQDFLDQSPRHILYGTGWSFGEEL